MSNSPKYAGNQRPTVERVGRSSMWPLAVLFIGLIAIVLYWPFLYELVANQITSGGQAGIERVDKKRAQAPANANSSPSFDTKLETALRYDREGNRILAAELFQELLELDSQNTGYTEQMAALLPRAADFYSRGSEIPAESIERLYLDAYGAIKKMHGRDYHDNENVHRGLQKLYSSVGRHQEAADQSRFLLEFYRRRYEDDEDARFNFVQPTTILLGHDLVAAGRYAEARAVYQAALDMSKAKGRPISAIEAFIQKTYEKAPAGSAFMAEQPYAPASIGTLNPSSTSTPVSAATGRDLKSAVEAITMDGVYIEQLQDKNDSLTIIGYADDNKMIASYLRKLQSRVGNPLLNMAKREDRQGELVSRFSITLRK